MLIEVYQDWSIFRPVAGMSYNTFLYDILNRGDW